MGVFMSNMELLKRVREDQIRRGNLPGSIKKRGLCLHSFTRWLGEKSLLEVERKDIEEFLDSRDICAGTRYGLLSHIHCFYQWAIIEDLTDQDPTRRVAKPRIRRHLPRPAHSDELSEALKIADPVFRCWLVLAAYQGLRVQEIAGLERADIADSEGLLRVVHGKGDKQRVLPLHPDVLSALRALPMPKSGRIFLRPQGGVYTPAALSQAFNRALRDHGVDATAHQLRHWFATNLYAATQDLRITQEMMGHSSPSTTAVYTAYSARRAEAGVSSLSLNGDVA